MDSLMLSLANWLQNTPLHNLMVDYKWSWPIAESLHFIGLSILIGTVGSFDLRLLGVGKGIPIAAFHKFIPFGIAGYLINVMTGISFLSGAPDQYMYNPAVQLKFLCMGVAGVNVLVFYLLVFGKIKTRGPGEEAPLAARIVGGVSLSMWIGVMSFGRLITFFRPPFHWCPWC